MTEDSLENLEEAILTIDEAAGKFYKELVIYEADKNILLEYALSISLLVKDIIEELEASD